MSAIWFAPGGLARLLAVTFGRPESSIGSAAVQSIVFADGRLADPAIGAILAV